jgi:hypothetical protein
VEFGPCFGLSDHGSTNHLFYGLADNAASIPGQLAVAPEHRMFYELLLCPGVILLTLSPIAIVGAIYGLWLSLREKKSFDFAFLIAFLGLFQVVTVAMQGTLALARYTLMLGTLCAVVAGCGLAKLGSKVRFSSDLFLGTLVMAMAANLTLIVGFSFRADHLGDKFRSISPLMQFPTHIEGVGQVLRPQTKVEDHFVIDNYNDEANLLRVVIGLPLLPGDRAFVPSSKSGIDPFPYINSYHPRFAILSGRGSVGSSIGLPPSCSQSWTVRGVNFRCVYENEIYRVYEIGPSGTAEIRENPRTSFPFAHVLDAGRSFLSVETTFP